MNVCHENVNDEYIKRKYKIEPRLKLKQSIIWNF